MQIVVVTCNELVVEIFDGDREFQFVVTSAALNSFVAFRTMMSGYGLWFDHESQDERTAYAQRGAWNRAVGDAFNRGRELVAAVA